MQVLKEEKLRDIVQSHTKLRIDIRDSVLEVVGYMGKVNDSALDGGQSGAQHVHHD